MIQKEYLMRRVEGKNHISFGNVRPFLRWRIFFNLCINIACVGANPSFPLFLRNKGYLNLSLRERNKQLVLENALIFSPSLQFGHGSVCLHFKARFRYPVCAKILVFLSIGEQPRHYFHYHFLNRDVCLVNGAFPPCYYYFYKERGMLIYLGFK